MRTIFVWPDATWCDRTDLPYMNHLSDDFAMVDVPWDIDDDEVDKIARTAVNDPL